MFYTKEEYARLVAQKRARQKQIDIRYQLKKKENDFKRLMQNITRPNVPVSTPMSVARNRRLMDIYNSIHSKPNPRADMAYAELQKQGSTIRKN